jgi:hypothetical protein
LEAIELTKQRVADTRRVELGMRSGNTRARHPAHRLAQLTRYLKPPLTPEPSLGERLDVLCLGSRVVHTDVNLPHVPPNSPVTEAMQLHYSAVNAEEMRSSLARVVSLAGFKQAQGAGR